MTPSGGVGAPGRSTCRTGRRVPPGSPRREPLGLEAARLAGRGRRPVKLLPAHDGAPGRATGEPFGIVHVFIAGEPAIGRLPQEAEPPVPDVPPPSTLGEGRGGPGGETEGVVQLAVGEQAAVRGDPGAVELELEPAVEGG